MHTVLAVLLLTARFYGTSDVSAPDRDVARDVAAHILRQAGITLAILDCNRTTIGHQGVVDGACFTPLTSAELIVRFIGSPASTPRRAGDTLGDAYVDTSAGAGALATVYVDRVAAISRAAGVDRATVLGRVAAHEIGHLLMGTVTHQSTGLMRAEWSTTLLQRQMPGDWRFSPAEARLVRAGLSRRAGDVARPISRDANATLPCLTVVATAPGAICPSCPVCVVSPADRMALGLLVEPRF